jgi:hypothetical protein
MKFEGYEELEAWHIIHCITKQVARDTNELKFAWQIVTIRQNEYFSGKIKTKYIKKRGPLNFKTSSCLGLRPSIKKA